MRTTVTLDADVELLLKDAAHATRRSFKETLNQALRKGLAGRSSSEPAAPYRVEPQPMGLRAGVDPAELNQLADDYEIDGFLATTRKLRVAEGTADDRP